MKPKYLRMIQGMKKGRKREWSVYVLRCGDGTLYTGIAKNVDARVKLHAEGKGAAYTRTHLPVVLVYQENSLTRSQALIREAEIKRLPRLVKDKIISRSGPLFHRPPPRNVRPRVCSKIKLLAMRILMLAILGLAGRLSAADIKLSGQIYAHYEYVNSEFFMNGAKADNFNAFDVGQAQLNVLGRVNDRVDAFLKAETTMLSRDNTANQLYLKQAWLRLNDIFPGANLRFGLVPHNAWRDHEENVWKHRYEVGYAPGR